MPINNQNGVNQPMTYASRPIATVAPVQTQNQQRPMTTGGLQWVQGYEAAKAWPVAPGSTVPLFDSENQIFYIKSVDINGFPQRLTVCEYNDITDKYEKNSNNANMDGFVTVDMLDEILDDKLNSFLEKLNKKQNNYHKNGNRSNKTRRYENEEDD